MTISNLELYAMDRALQKLLVTDFDGTMCRRDFYTCAVEHCLTPENLSPWHDYAAGKITHFESLRRIFSKIRATDDQIELILREMQFDTKAADSIRRLRERGWDVKVVSNGCGWYIERLFQQHGIDVELHTNPGEYSPDAGLQMRLPLQSPFCLGDVGISKAAIVNDAIERGYERIAFAGDGRPDLDPAMLVAPDHRFARGWLAETLTERKEPFESFEIWSEVVEMLCEQAP